MLTGRLIGAEEAKAIGLVHRVAEAANFAEAVRELAARLAAGAPIAHRWTKRAIHRSLSNGMDDEFEFEIFAQVQCLQTQDHREGVRAFKERRKPEFRNA
jgi:enoyl-CoA hydratase/carnithine racemase